MLWTAWPLAPLTRLSSALITINRPVRASSRQAISMTFVPTTFFVSGNALPSSSRTKGSLRIRGAVTRADLFTQLAQTLGCSCCFPRSEIERGENAPIHGNQVGRELNHHLHTRRQRQLLLDFGQVPVLRQTIGADALIALHEQVVELSLAPRATDPAEGIGNDAVRLDQPRLEQRDRRQQYAGGIAARGSDERGLLDLGAIDLRQAIDRLRQQLRRGVIMRVELFIDRRAFHAEVRA